MADFTEVDALPSTNMAASLSNSVKKLMQRVKLWANAYADYSAAAAMYEDLSGLSNAELQKRGLSRDTLAWDVCQSCDNTAGH
jgi:hypothetical protein